MWYISLSELNNADIMAMYANVCTVYSNVVVLYGSDSVIYYANVGKCMHSEKQHNCSHGWVGQRQSVC